jgi:glycosyltransferase involved in cell wall biosynthesis
MIRDGYPAEKVVVKPNSVADPGMYLSDSTPSDPPYFAFIGRLLSIKGVSTLLEAWGDVPAGPILRIAGDGALRAEVEARAAADPSVEYLGWVDDLTAVNRLMAGATAVVVPSEWYEGLPLVILRSLAVGTPVVVSDLDNICEAVVADGAGFTFPVGQARPLGQLLKRLTIDPKQSRLARANARSSYERRYSPQADIELLLAIYEELLAHSR